MKALGHAKENLISIIHGDFTLQPNKYNTFFHDEISDINNNLNSFIEKMDLLLKKHKHVKGNIWCGGVYGK